MFESCWRKFHVTRLQLLVIEKAYPLSTILSFLQSHTKRPVLEAHVRAHILGELIPQADELIAYADLYAVPVDFLTRPQFGGLEVDGFVSDLHELIKQLATDPRRKRIRKDYVKQNSLASFRRFWYIRRSRKKRKELNR